MRVGAAVGLVAQVACSVLGSTGCNAILGFDEAEGRAECTATTAAVPIAQLQDGTLGADELVTVRGTVSAVFVSNHAFWVQNPTGGPWSGVYVYAGSGGIDLRDLRRDDDVFVTGTSTEYQGTTEIDASDLRTAALLDCGPTEPIEAALVSLAELASDEAEPWESVLVAVEDVAVSQPVRGENHPLGKSFGEWTVTDGVNDLVVSSLLYSASDDFDLWDDNAPGDSCYQSSCLGDEYVRIVGVLAYTFGDFKIVVRDARDIVPR